MLLLNDDGIAKATAIKYIMMAIDEAKKSTCHRSKCGSVIVNNGHLLGKSYNSMPLDNCGSCFKDKISMDFKSDRTCCIHAEQRAIMDALKSDPLQLKGSTLYFIRLDLNDEIRKAGQPFCTICSKMALDVGIKHFILWHDEGITIYDSDEYNRFSFQANPKAICDFGCGRELTPVNNGKKLSTGSGRYICNSCNHSLTHKDIPKELLIYQI
jgi:deoxycytidylate deaminase